MTNPLLPFKHCHNPNHSPSNCSHFLVLSPPSMAAVVRSSEPHSRFKSLNPYADPFLLPRAPPPFTSPITLVPQVMHVGSFMSGYGNLYHIPRTGYFWPVVPYPSVSCYDVQSQLVLPYQVGFIGGAVHHDEKLADMEFYQTVSGRNCKLSRRRQKIKSARWVEKKEDVTEKMKISLADAPSTFSTCSSGITTLMIKNIPNQLKRRDLLQLLDRYCRMENNQKGVSETDFCCSEYDFVYLPMDFRRSWHEGKVSNLGYAFVNFTTSSAALRFRRMFDNYRWEVNVNKKICEVTVAKIQGREALKNAFKNKIFWCSADEYLPVVLSPASDGYRRYKTGVVGRRIHRLPRKPLKKLSS